MPGGDAMLSVGPAVSNMAHCKENACKQLIEKGTPRACVPMFIQGRTLTGSFHPACLAKGLQVEIVTRSNAGACKASGRKFDKGVFRLVVQGGNARFGLGLAAAGKLLPPLLAAANINGRNLPGLDAVPSPMQAQFLQALRDAGHKPLKSAATPVAIKQKSVAPLSRDITKKRIGVTASAIDKRASKKKVLKSNTSKNT